MNTQFAQMFVNHIVNLLAYTEREDGQDLAEYALLLVFIAIAVIAALTALGPQIAAIYVQITDALTV